MVYRLGGKRIVIATGLKAEMVHWNKTKMRAREVATYFDGPTINAQLSFYEATCMSLTNEMTLQYGSIDNIPVKEFKLRFEELVGSNKVESVDNTLLGFITHLIESKKTQPEKFKPASIKVYNSLRSNLKKYLGKSNPVLEDVDRGVLSGFQRFLFSRGLNNNYVQKQWQTLKTVLHEAKDEGMSVSDEFKQRSLAVSRKPVDNIYLTIEEIDQLLSLDLHTRPRLEKVRDIFVVGCYTGLRFQDLLSLKPTDVSNVGKVKFLNVTARKTNTKVKIPVKPLVDLILTKYNFQFPRISNQKANKYIKEVCELASLDDSMSLRKYPGGTVVEQQYKKWEIVSFHTARRSFATNAYKTGAPIASIMKITGHTKPSTFMDYIKIDEEENAQIIALNPMFQ